MQGYDWFLEEAEPYFQADCSLFTGTRTPASQIKKKGQ